MLLSNPKREKENFLSIIIDSNSIEDPHNNLFLFGNKIKNSLWKRPKIPIETCWSFFELFFNRIKEIQSDDALAKEIKRFFRPFCLVCVLKHLVKALSWTVRLIYQMVHGFLIVARRYIRAEIAFELLESTNCEFFIARNSEKLRFSTL